MRTGAFNPARDAHQRWTGVRWLQAPYYITASDGTPLSFAGLWDTCKDAASGNKLLSCTIIVTAANAFTRVIHDRMPVVLDRADIGAWLTGQAGTELLKPADDAVLRMWPVSKRVNRSDSDDPALIEKIAA